MIIAIDGPAAAGKGTLGRRLARAYGFAYLDTGALYRAVAVAVGLAGVDPDDEASVEALAQSLDLGLADHPDLRAEQTGAIASKISRYAGVRAALHDIQTGFATKPGGDVSGAVLDGRDIGTVICPTADVKLFVTASADARAKRRLKDEQARGNMGADYQAILADIEARDAQDASRSHAPLKPAEDAHLIDTTNLSIEAAFSRAARLVDDALKR